MSGNDSSLGGDRLLEYLQTFSINTRWISGHPVIWQTGQKDGLDSEDPAHSTHCSAFIAAVALDLNLYILRPKHHVLKLLSNAQVAWLLGTGAAVDAPSAEASGWKTLGTAGDSSALKNAVAAASRGSLVIAGYQNPDLKIPGHLVTVLPTSNDDIPMDGPEVISVATSNHPSISMKSAFEIHHGAWPDNIHIFSHPTELEVGAIRESGSTAPMP